MATVEKLRRRIGRRGMVLILFAVLFATRGIKAIFNPSTDDGRLLFYFQLPLSVRVMMWLIPAFLAIIAALISRRGNDAFGFAAISIPAVVIFISYFASAIFTLIGYNDYANAWLDATTWGMVLLIILMVSGWKEDNTPRPLKGSE